jgi:predicted nicotinamide N-methyase
MTQPGQALLDLEREVATQGTGIDRLRLVEVPFVPEVRLHLAEDPTVWWARMEAATDTLLTPPFWASAWAGGRAVARYILDHPQAVAGKTVLDVASGSGLVAIAAGRAGAARVVANDVDPYAVAAITLNARANDVAVTECHADLLDRDCGDYAETVLVGDAFYDSALAGRMMAFLERAVARGAQVLVGDPGRGHVPDGRFEVVATYPMAADTFADSQLTDMNVLRLRAQ